MALSVGSGEITITAAGGTGSKTYAHGLSFTPTLIIWFGNGRAAAVDSSSDVNWLFGASADSTHEWNAHAFADDNNTTSTANSGFDNDASISFISTVADMEADFTSVDGTNFTINISDAPAADRTVQFIAFAGTGLSSFVGTATIAAGTSAQAFTGVGFTPKLLIFARARLVTGASNGIGASVAFTIGAASAAGTEWTMADADRDALGTTDCNTILTNTRCLLVPTNTGTVGGNLNLTSFDSDGFTVTPQTDFTGNTEIGYIAFGGANFSAKVGTGVYKATTGTQAYTGVGFKPQALLTVNVNAVTNNTSAATLRTSIGVAHGSSNRSAAMFSLDNAAVSDTGNATRSTVNLLTYDLTASTPAVLTSAALSSFDADGFTENFTVSDTIQKLFGYVAMRLNAAPVITSNGGGASAAINSAENQTAVTTVTATDADSDTITYSKSGTDAAFFNIDSGTGVLTWASAPNFEVKADGNADGVYLVTVIASDGVLTDTQDLSVTVTNVNEAPVITSNGGGATASISVEENTTAVTTVVATDVDAATTITYSISAGNDSALFGIDGSTGVLTFLVAPDYETPLDANTDNAYLVTVRASDGTLTDTQALTITVTDAASESSAVHMGPPCDEDDEI